MTESQSSRSASPPAHFWIVGVLGVVYFTLGGVTFARMQLQSPEYLAALTSREVEILQSFSVWVFVILWPIAIGGLVGCLLMLLRRPSAPLPLLISLVFAVIHELQINLFYDLPPVSLWERVLAPVQLIGFSAIFWWFARAMKKEGYLGARVSG